jgi:hypothetical protein
MTHGVSMDKFGTNLQFLVVIYQTAVIFIFPMVLYFLVGQSFLFVDASKSRSDTPQSVVFLWTSDQPDPENSTWQHATLKTDWHPNPSLGFEPAIPTNEQQQTHDLDCKATGINTVIFIVCLNIYRHFDLRGLSVTFPRFYSPFILATKKVRGRFIRTSSALQPYRPIVHSLVLLKMDEIIARNMMSWLELLINRFFIVSNQKSQYNVVHKQMCWQESSL